VGEPGNEGRHWVDSVSPDQEPALARWLSDQGLLDPPANPRSDLSPLTAFVRPWIQQAPEGAVAWACSLRAGIARIRAIEQASSALGRQTGVDRQV
jgi:hypothetical protein